MSALRPSETVSLWMLPHASYSAVHTASPFALCAAIGVPKRIGFGVVAVRFGRFVLPFYAYR